VSDHGLITSPSSFLKTSTSIRRVHPNASPHHVGWKTKVRPLFSFDTYPLRHPSTVPVVRAACQIRPDATYQIHNHTSLLSVHMGIPRGVEDMVGTKRYLGRLLPVLAQLVNRRLGGWSVALINPAQVVPERCVRISSQLIAVNLGCAVPVTHATSPSTTLRNAMTQHSKILTTALICYTTSAVAFTFFHVIASLQTPNSGLRFFVKSKCVL
jgi:hypothetical protein